MYRKSSTHSRGFTLIELLVEIAVIALLVAIVLPALSKAKIYAQKIVCRSNIKQIVLGMRFFSEQNDDELPANTRWGGVGGADLCTNRVPDEGNVGYLEGHVEWRRFEDMRYCIGGTRFYW